jgi:hypothetical protein
MSPTIVQGWGTLRRVPLEGPPRDDPLHIFDHPPGDRARSAACLEQHGRT